MLKRKVDFNKIAKRFKKSTVQKKLTPIGNMAIYLIKDRTQNKNKDADNRPFKTYSKTYKERKIETKRSGKVDLTYSSNMLNALQFKDIKGIKIGVTLYFVGSKENEKAYYNNKTRKFFGFTDKEYARIRKELEKII